MTVSRNESLNKFNYTLHWSSTPVIRRSQIFWSNSLEQENHVNNVHNKSKINQLKMVQRRAARFITWPTGREPLNGPMQGCKVYHLTNRQGTSKWTNAGLQGSSPDQQAGNMHVVLVICFNTWTGSVWKTSVKMLDLTWCI